MPQGSSAVRPTSGLYLYLYLNQYFITTSATVSKVLTSTGFASTTVTHAASLTVNIKRILGKKHEFVSLKT